MSLLFTLARPVLHALDAETAHLLTVRALSCLPARPPAPDPAALEQTLWGRRFPNPVGLAAGFDKNAETMAAMLGLGFGFVEAGTVTPRPQAGNPRPRLFRLPVDGAVINRMGFNNQGLDAYVARLRRYRERGGRGLIAANIGKNKDTAAIADDYVICARAVAPYADFLVVNVSSPNTPGLRDLQGAEQLREIFGRIRDALDSPPPLVLKIAPDLSRAGIDSVAATTRELGLDGLIVSNTTIDRPASLKDPAKSQAGGLSGRPLFARSTAMIGAFAQILEDKVAIIGVGGIASGADAWAKIRAGASLVELYTALVYNGPALVDEIKAYLAQALADSGLARLEDAVGRDRDAAASALKDSA